MLAVNVKTEQLTNLVQLGRDLNAAEKQYRIKTVPPTKKVKNRCSMSPSLVQESYKCLLDLPAYKFLF